MRHYGLVGAGGFGREVMPLVELRLARALANGSATVRFLVEGQPPDPVINGVPVMALDEFLGLPEERFFNIAIGDSAARERVANHCAIRGAKAFSVNAENSRNLMNNQIGEGSIFCPFSMVTANAKIGKFFHANIYSYVAHDCEIGDFVTFSPNVHCNGNIKIEDHAYIGTGAVLRQGSQGKPLVIGKGAVVGMGAVVTKDVLPGTTVVGNPAHPLDRGK